ncbi:MAG TPA: hypothetical protein PLZ93_23640 [Nocardioides sp.]|uniref:hypothetical protein n=1 Tax=uncultured Nocardioides sp. TaxID=198441 RepID=UPI000EE8DE60|nr:hypothetical protein [uncultured Nocardioides sp.]HCB07927.1 hypothetical protein [Nocardioides sp.]HRD60164.1 hypothetical protein [Nocardioides sp.]HRI98640.1 hypothetical protein [Nocardioides sp.]HRK48381.1 hypothetical protein [Nocardioides sp.]
MIGLLRVELTRLRWRRAVLALLALGVVAPALVFAATVVSTEAKPFDEVVEQYGKEVLTQVEDCVAHPRRYGVDQGGSDGVQRACERVISGYYGEAELDLRAERESNSGPAAIALLTLVLLLVGTTFAGHDWNTGSISNQLLFEPRRHRVWLAKLLAVGLVATLLSTLVLLAHWTGLYAVSSLRNLDQPDLAVAAAYKQVVLGVMVVCAAGLLGFGLTMLLRSTVATLGVLFATGFGGVILVAAGVASAERVMPWGNFVAWVVGGYDYYVYDDCFSADCVPVRHIERSDSAVYFAVILAVVLVGSLASFRRRDLP